MRLDKSAFEDFIDQLHERMNGRSLLCEFANITRAEVERHVSGAIRSIAVSRSGPLNIPAHPGLAERAVEIILLTNWARVGAVAITLYFIEKDRYRAEIVFGGKAVTPYDDEFTSYIVECVRELGALKTDYCHEMK